MDMSSRPQLGRRALAFDAALALATLAAGTAMTSAYLIVAYPYSLICCRSRLPGTRSHGTARCAWR